MLTDLQTVCNPAESEFINLILNFFRSRKIYSAYRTAASQQNFQQSQSMIDSIWFKFSFCEGESKDWIA